MSDIDEIIKGHVITEVRKASDGIRDSIKDEAVAVVLEEIKSARMIRVKSGRGVYKAEGLSHEMTESVLKYIGARVPLLLVGPAGSGKTHIAIQCAKLLGLDSYSISVNEQTSKSDFLGYVDANSNLVKTNFRRAYEDGGVFIIDEIDAGNPNILTVVNSALSNDMCPFPDGMVNRHANFVCVCTANTFGEGESIQYIGRNILDSATRDRFATLYIDYSVTIEGILIPNFNRLLRELREHFKKNNINIVVSTRAGIRIEAIKTTQGKVTKSDIITCLNLHQEVLRDSAVDKLIAKYASA